MAFQQVKVVAFGSSRAGLTTVGYQLVNADQSNNGLRVTAGVFPVGSGGYAANVTFPDLFHGLIKWDTGEDTPRYASEAVDHRSLGAGGGGDEVSTIETGEIEVH